MLSRPFRGMPRGRLFLLLVIFLLLEAAGAAGLYTNYRNAAAATPTPVAPRPTATARILPQKVLNFPRTVVVGHTETFSVRLKGLSNVVVTYEIAYPDGSSVSEDVKTDVTGYSSYSFKIAYKPSAFRDTIGISVIYNGQVRAATRFAVQQAG